MRRRKVEKGREMAVLMEQELIALKKQLLAHSAEVEGRVYYLSISRYLERMGDLATNIAEDVVYPVDGEIIRHGGIQTCL